MHRLFSLMLAVLGGWAGWWVGALIGTLTGLVLGLVGSGIGMYAGRRIKDYYFG